MSFDVVSSATQLSGERSFTDRQDTLPLSPPIVACRPLLHALVHPGVASGFGIELDSIKCQKAEAFLERTVQDLARRVRGLDLPAPLVQCSSVESVCPVSFRDDWC